jgi:hypothetical protein
MDSFYEESERVFDKLPKLGGRKKAVEAYRVVRC